MEAFREEVRQWLEANCPESMRTPATSEDDTVWGGRNPTFPSEDAKKWLEAMGGKGWTCPTWPRYLASSVSAAWSRGNLDGDGDVDLTDLAIVLGNVGQSRA